MKAKLICGAILAMAAGFAQAQDATGGCLAGLVAEPRLAAIAGKLDVANAPQRVATEDERVIVALWAQLRRQCFESTTAQRRAESSVQEAAFQRSLFGFQQRLVVELQDGRLTYAEFNRRRAELSAAAGRI
jgi:hypothetical protein